MPEANMVTFAKWVIVDLDQRYIIVKGENLLFLREAVKFNAREPWSITEQSDSELMIFDPRRMDPSQEPRSSDNAVSMVSIKTAYGQILQPILEDYCDETTAIGASRMFFKIVQTMIVKATPPLSIRPKNAVMNRLDNIMHCVPALKGKKLSTELIHITTCTNTNGGNLENHIQEINYMAKTVVKYLRSSLKVDYYKSSRLQNLQQRAHSLLVQTGLVMGVVAVGIVFLPIDLGIGAALLGASAAGVLILRPSETIIDGYDFVLNSAIHETSKWSESENSDDRTGTNGTYDLESVLTKQVEGSSPEFKEMVKEAHSMGIKDVSCFKSEAFQNATSESRIKLLKRIKVVCDTISLYNAEVAGVHFVGIFGAEDAGKSTFIQKVLEKFGPPGAQLPETGSHTHTKVVRSYMLNSSLWLVDFPGSDGAGPYADTWKQFTALSSSSILFLNFEFDMKREDVEMYQETKKNLGAQTEVAIVFNKVDERFTPRHKEKFTTEYFKDQRERNEAKLGCAGTEDRVYFSCVDPDPPEKLDELKVMGVLGFVDLVNELVKPKCVLTMHTSGN